MSGQMDPAMLLQAMLQQRLSGLSSGASAAAAGAAGGGGGARGTPGITMQRTGDTGRTPPAAAAAAAAEDGSMLAGRSRRYRGDNGWELQGPLAALPYANSVITLPNPVVPLKFEQPPGKWQALHHICTETMNAAQFSDSFVSTAAMDAHVKALEAYDYPTPEEAVKVAHEALSISPLCPEAYNVLALAQADSYEEALELYRRAEELGPQILDSECLEDTLERGIMWQRTPFRAYYRAMYGVANTLRKMCRHQESLAAYDKLLAADGNWYSWSSYVNVMALYPFVLLEAKGPKAVLDYMRNYNHTDDHLSYLSSSMYWTGAFVLADLLYTEAKGVSARANGAKVTPDDGWAADGLDVCRFPGEYVNTYKGVRSRPLFCFCHNFFQAVDMLLGDKALPAGINTMQTGQGKEQAAAAFAYTTGSQWRSRPSAMERLARYRNTYEIRSIIQDLRNNRSGLLQIDMQELRGYLTHPRGFHKQGLEREAGGGERVKSLMYELLDFPDGREFGKDELKVLKWLLEAGVSHTDSHPNKPNDQPLHMACYQAYGPEAVRILLAAGADPLLANPEGLTALAMAANQGNWREMQAVLRAMPHLLTANAAQVKYTRFEGAGPRVKRVTVPEALLMDIFSSTCLPCLEGAGACMRCSNGIPHSKHADFYKFAEVVVAEADIRKPSKALLDEMQECVKAMGARSPWHKLQKCILRAIERQKQTRPPAAAAGQQQQQPPQPPSSAKAAAAAAPAGVDAAVATPAGVRQCWGCGLKPGVGGVTLQKCSGCRRAMYCSRACQEAAWKDHKADCKRWKVEKSAAEKAA